VTIMNPNFEARNPNIEALNNYPCRARAAHSKNVNDVSRNFPEDGHRHRAFPANTLITLQRLQLPGLASPPPRTKSVESPPLAHGVGWFMSLAFIGFVEFTLGSQLSALCCLSLTTVCYRKARRRCPDDVSGIRYFLRISKFKY
jgi:hypothetical protein